MSEGWGGIDPIDDILITERAQLGTCQARNRYSRRRCRNRAEVQEDGSAFCEKHRLVREGV